MLFGFYFFSTRWGFTTFNGPIARPFLSGSAGNLAYHVCGSIAGNLHNTAFVIEKNELLLQLSGDKQDVFGDAVKRRMDGVRAAWKEYGGK